MGLLTAPISPERAGAVLTVDLAALCKNWHFLNSKIQQGCDCGAVVKADAYGLGVKHVAPALLETGCKTFYVAHLEEGINLRNILGSIPRIIVMHGPSGKLEDEFFAHDLVPVLNTPQQVSSWRKFMQASDVPKETIIQVDTGMNRLGLSNREFVDHMNDSESFQGLAPLALMTHLACAGMPEHPLNQIQLEKFVGALRLFRTKFPEAKASLANSSGIFLGEGWHFDLARPGAALYGVGPQNNSANPMLPVVGLQAEILQIRHVDTAGNVGYGATFQAADGARLATVSIGYADGFHRALSNAGSARLGGMTVQVAGVVSMDLLTFNVSGVPESVAVPGAMIDIISTAHTVDDVAREAGTIGYEILTSLGQRFARHYLPLRCPD